MKVVLAVYSFGSNAPQTDTAERARRERAEAEERARRQDELDPGVRT